MIVSLIVVLNLHVDYCRLCIFEVVSLISPQSPRDIPRGEPNVPWPIVFIYDVLVCLVEPGIIECHRVVEQALGV